MMLEMSRVQITSLVKMPFFFLPLETGGFFNSFKKSIKVQFSFQFEIRNSRQNKFSLSLKFNKIKPKNDLKIES